MGKLTSEFPPNILTDSWRAGHYSWMDGPEGIYVGRLVGKLRQRVGNEQIRDVCVVQCMRSADDLHILFGRIRCPLFFFSFKHPRQLQEFGT